MTKNRLCDLNDHLFAQIERLSEEGLSPEHVERECRRAMSMAAVAEHIIRAAAVQVQVAKMVNEYDGTDPRKYLSFSEKPKPTLMTLVANK